VYLLATLGYHFRLVAMTTPHSSWAINGFLLQRAFGFLQVSLLLSLCMTIMEQLMPHASEDAKSASRTLTRGRLRVRFWGLAIGAGLVLPTLILGWVRYLPFRPATESGFVAATVAAAVFALAGVWWFEDVWVRAGQSVPLS